MCEFDIIFLVEVSKSAPFKKLLSKMKGFKCTGMLMDNHGEWGYIVYNTKRVKLAYGPSPAEHISLKRTPMVCGFSVQTDTQSNLTWPFISIMVHLQSGGDASTEQEAAQLQTPLSQLRSKLPNLPRVEQLLIGDFNLNPTRLTNLKLFVICQINVLVISLASASSSQH